MGAGNNTLNITGGAASVIGDISGGVGGTLRITNAGGINGQTFASLSLDDNSIFDLDFTTSLTFNALGTLLSEKSLAVTDYSYTLAHDYAFRFLGDLSTNSDFLTLVGETTINGGAATFVFDGVFTDVVAVPEPATSAFGIALIGATLARRRRATAARG